MLREGGLPGTCVMPALRYRCPNTGMTVEAWTESDDSPDQRADDFFDTVFCQACGGVHLVNPRTGRVAGQRSTSSSVAS
jgi:hypothetical protein